VVGEIRERMNREARRRVPEWCVVYVGSLWRGRLLVTSLGGLMRNRHVVAALAVLCLLTGSGLGSAVAAPKASAAPTVTAVSKVARSGPPAGGPAKQTARCCPSRSSRASSPRPASTPSAPVPKRPGQVGTAARTCTSGRGRPTARCGSSTYSSPPGCRVGRHLHRRRHRAGRGSRRRNRRAVQH
jgi:hypothetical protein